MQKKKQCQATNVHWSISSRMLAWTIALRRMLRIKNHLSLQCSMTWLRNFCSLNALLLSQDDKEKGGNLRKKTMMIYQQEGANDL